MSMGNIRAFNRLAPLIDALVGVFAYDRRLVVTLASSRLSRLLRGDEGSARGINLASFGKAGFLRALQAPLDGKEGFFEGLLPLMNRVESPWITMQTFPERGLFSRLVGGIGIVIDLSERRRVELALVRRWDMEKAVADASSRFAVQTDLDRAIDQSLADLGKILKMDRVYVIQMEAGGATMSNTHEWCAEGVPSYLAELQSMPVQAYPWLMERLERGETVRIDDVSLMPQEAVAERAEFSREGILSLVLLPLTSGFSLTGIIGMDSTHGTGQWSFEDLNLLGTFAELVSSALGRAQTMETLRRSETRYRNVVDNAHDMIQVLDPAGAILFVNPAWLRITGYSAQETMGRSIMEILHEGSRAVCGHCLQRAKAGHEVKGMQIKLISKTGFPIVMEGNATSYVMENGEAAVVGIFHDVTEELKLEGQLRHAQKMEALGTLTGGIAHDFNNILTAILGYSQFILMKEGGNERVRTNMEKILAGATRAANLTQSMLAFSRKQAITPSSVDLNEIVRTTVKLVERLLGENITVKMNLTRENVTLFADHTQIEQVIMNLFTNARDAMPQGGTITVSTECFPIDAAFIRSHEYGEPGMYALMTVSDTGTGMSVDIRQRIFEPFFTTKEQGKGTGLGLAIVYGIVKQHGGYINCYSEPGIGTSFKTYLPLSTAQAAAEKPAEAATATRGVETVLIAEDEADVRAVIRQVLEEAGYAVIPAENGSEAVRIFKESAAKVDLLIMDLAMPKMGGRQAYEEIRLLKPGIKVLFASGYPADFIRERQMLADEFDFISKPIPPVVLLKKVRDLLDSGASVEGGRAGATRS